MQNTHCIKTNKQNSGSNEENEGKKTLTNPSIIAKQITRQSLRTRGKKGIPKDPRNLNKMLRGDNYQISLQNLVRFNKAFYTLKVDNIWIRSPVTSPHTSRDSFPVVITKDSALQSMEKGLEDAADNPTQATGS